jgi:hypothetical protein
MSGNRLMTATIVLGVLLALTVWKWQARQSEDAGTEQVTAKLPKLDKATLDELEVTTPGKPTVKLVKKDKLWSLTEPLAAKADENAVDSALAKLAELEATGIAATQAENHKKLEIDDAQAVHVVAKQAGKTVADVWFGALRNGNTMVREQGNPTVIAAKGSLKYAFEKELKEWRDRTIVESDTDKLATAAFENAKGTLRFVLEGADGSKQWKQAAGEKAIAGFDPAKAKSVITSITHLHASDFAVPETTREAAGLAPAPAATVTLTSSDPTVAPIVLHVGGKQGDEYYVAREGSEPIYVVSQFSGERLLASTDKFVKDEPKPEGAAPKAPGMPSMPSMPNLPGMPGHAPH